jgi:hypothetical protein
MRGVFPLERLKIFKIIQLLTYEERKGRSLILDQAASGGGGMIVQKRTTIKYRDPSLRSG